MTRSIIGPSFGHLWTANLVFEATGSSHQTSLADSPLSIKSVRAGKAHWRTEAGSFRVEPQSFLIVNRGESYSLEVDEPAPVTTFVVFFADAFASEVSLFLRSTSAHLLDTDPCASQGPPTGINNRLWREPSSLSAAYGRLSRLLALKPESEELEDALRETLLALFGLETEANREREEICALKRSTRDELHRRVMRGKTIIDDAYDQEFDLRRIAQEACLSAHHFHDAFKQVVGCTPYAYAARLRIEQAKRLLQSSSLALPDVCAAIGYSSVPSFVRSFGRHTGFSPGGWRKAHRNKKIPGPG